jgi:ABC-2 type transport system ATP-binding protein
VSVVSVEHLKKSYGRTVAVADVSFQVEEGEIFGIIGSNGSGKTTSVECLQGLREADSGKISVLGLNPRQHRQQLRALIGSQLQESALPDRMKVWEAIDLFASLASGAVDRHELIDQWGLSEKENAFFSDLSGGQRQRLFVALALVSKPKLVFLDEMTAGLDPAARREAWQLIRGVQQQGTTIVLVTHFMDEAGRFRAR